MCTVESHHSAAPKQPHAIYMLAPSTAEKSVLRIFLHGGEIIASGDSNEEDHGSGDEFEAEWRFCVGCAGVYRIGYFDEAFASQNT